MKIVAPGTAEAALRAIARMVLVAAALVFSFQAVPAHAAFPGENGKIALEKQRSDGANFKSVWTINPDGSGLTELIPGYAANAAWSPSGTRIAYEFSGLYVANADGSNQQPWYDDGSPILSIDWSPDETSIAFLESPGMVGGPYTLFVMPAEPTVFPSAIASSDGFVAGLAWSPDGSRIAMPWDFGDPHGIYTISPDGTGKTMVPGTDTVGWIGGLDWSPDSSRLAFAGSQAGVEGIFTIKLNGTDLARVTSAPAGETDRGPAWSPDGKSIAFNRSGTLSIVGSSGGTVTPIPQAGTAAPSDWQPILKGYPRPKGATPFLTYLVPAYNACASPNRQHGPPLAFASCNPPTQSSTELTVGSADSNGKPTKSVSSVRFDTVVGNPSIPGDQADVKITAQVIDVYTQAGLADYAGELTASTPLRITDKLNTPHPGGPGAGTVSDIPYGFTIPCAETADTTIGGACLLSTSADALAPGAVSETKRSIWALGQVAVYDADNAPFMKQGIFVP